MASLSSLRYADHLFADLAPYRAEDHCNVASALPLGYAFSPHLLTDLLLHMLAGLRAISPGLFVVSGMLLVDHMLVAQGGRVGADAWEAYRCGY